MKKLYVEVDDKKRIVNWANVPFSKNNIEIEIPKEHEFFDGGCPFRLDEEDSLIKDNSYELEEARKLKKNELSFACESTILNGFAVTFEQDTYLFSSDLEAQMNFDKAERAFDKARMENIFWTAYTVDRTPVRILLDKNSFEIVYVEHLNHINNNIAKYRDFLLPILEDATTLQEIELIKW